MKFEDIRVHPELREIIRDKDFTFIFGEHSDDIKNVSIFGNEKALDLMEKYGAYLNNLFSILEGYKVRGRVDQYKKPDDTPFTFEDYEELIKRSIFKSCYEGSRRYYPDTAPEFLKETHPELFLDEGAPQELIEFFYSNQERTDSPFIDLQTHTDWLPYLANKSIKTAVLRRAYYKETYMMYFEKLGDEVAIALGIKYAGAIDMMLKNDKLNDLFAWNQKTGGRFLPDYAIMSNIPLEEADNFLAHGDNWRRVMKNREFTRDLESKDALAKISCIFGAFNGDSRGLKQADDLLSSLPRTISKNYAHLIGQIDDDIESITRRSEFFHEGMSEEEIKEAKTKWMTSLSNSNNQEIADLLLVLIADANEDKFPIDYTKPLMEQFYRPRDISEERKKRGEQPDGSRVLTFNPDRYSNVTTAIRNILGTRSSLPILTADKAHKLFGPAKAQYDPAFREFFMKNEERILTDPELIKYLGRIQRSFDKIRTVNSNRVLTLDLAIQFVKANAFDNIEVGNDKVATVARIADFTQEEFEVLQQIYNVGKQRVFSSIPRVQDTSKDKYGQSYSYEMLSLDDPLALGIGELSDCCQRINDCAEMCVEHSMIDKNGRVFVIRDQEGNIVAQSWVWRNGDVLCFDNIEIPDNAFERAKRSKNPLTTEELSDLVFGIYQKAAGQLIEQDKVVYEELLHNGQITQEQYDGLRLGKVTVGLGYNDIKNSILRNSAPDKGHIARPLPFTPAVPLSRSLYTNDSKEQHILVEREGRTDYSGPTLALHSDKPTELTDATIEESDVRLFNSLATSSDDDYEVLDDESQTPLEDIASSINLHSNNVRAVMHPNYGIIYESDEEKVKIGELVFNTLVIEKGIEKDITPTVLNQLKLALDQILQGKRLDMSQLDNKAKEMIERALAINEELDEERGVSHAR